MIMWSEIASGLVGVLAGGLVGHRLAIGRDKRKEQNDVREPIWAALSKSVSDKNASHIKLNAFPKTAVIQAYRARVSDREYKRFDALFSDLRQFIEQYGISDGFGGRIIPPNQHDDFHRKLRKLQKHTRHR